MIKLLRAIGVSFFTLTTLICFGQHELAQNIQGKVVDQNTSLGIESVYIILQNENTKKTTVTDQKGEFKFVKVPVGRYNLFLSHINYENKVLRDILVESGKEKFTTIELSISTTQLEEITIESDRDFQGELDNISTYSFSQEQNQRFAATFNDPARMALSYPGVTLSNDQSNNISIRGNSPFSNSWRLQGAEIVNPNHLTNAGTLSDRPSVVGGGVSVISAQLMDQTKLITGAFPANYGNSPGGILDVRLRRGNSSDHEHTLQAGILGIDLATEGPFSKNSDNSYLVNYRYSTIGLLQSLGVEVSPEQINFQDLSYNLSFKSKKENEWGLFGIFGLSQEKFHAERDSSDWELIEDRIDTKFTSNMGAAGLTNMTKTGEHSSVQSVLAYSEIRTDRAGEYVMDNYQNQFIENDTYNQGILSLNSTFSLKTRSNHQISTGLKFVRTNFNLLSQSKDSVMGSLNTLISNEGNFQVFKVFGEWTPSISKKILANLGIHIVYFNMNKEISVEPRLEITRFISPRTTLTVNYGLVSQYHFPQVYFVTKEANGSLILPNKDLKMTRSHQVNLSFVHRFNVLTTLKTEVYWQRHFRVPVSSDPESTFSLLNATDVLIDEELVNKGTGRNMGIEVILNRTFKNGYYFTAVSSLYDSRYKALDGISRNTRFNGNYISTLTLGKEIQSLRHNKNRIFGVNFRFIWQGGYRHTPIDVSASQNAGEPVYLAPESFSKKYDDFIRLDLRIYFKKYKSNYTRTLSFDIQNVTARQNIAYQYYDPFTNNIETKYQLGLLPFISYKIEF